MRLVKKVTAAAETPLQQQLLLKQLRKLQQQAKQLQRQLRKQQRLQQMQLEQQMLLIRKWASAFINSMITS